MTPPTNYPSLQIEPLTRIAILVLLRVMGMFHKMVYGKFKEHPSFGKYLQQGTSIPFTVDTMNTFLADIFAPALCKHKGTIGPHCLPEHLAQALSAAVRGVNPQANPFYTELVTTEMAKEIATDAVMIDGLKSMCGLMQIHSALVQPLVIAVMHRQVVCPNIQIQSTDVDDEFVWKCFNEQIQRDKKMLSLLLRLALTHMFSYTAHLIDEANKKGASLNQQAQAMIQTQIAGQLKQFIEKSLTVN